MKNNAIQCGTMEQGVKLHSKGRHYCGRNAEVEGDVFKFKGAGGSVGVVKILEPMSPMLNYFEYEISSRGQKCALGVGVGEQSYPMDRMPGWNRNGIGYHADDGRMFYQDGYGKAFGATCTEGDRMGCGVDFDTDCGYGFVNIFFTKNGKQVGDVVRMKRPLHGLYPLVGMHSRGEKVRYLGHWKKVPNGIQDPMELDHSPNNIWLRSNGVRYLDDGQTVEYAGDGLDKQDVGIAQLKFQLDRTLHYFEMEILSAGKEGWLAIGLAKITYPLHRHPGWNKGSVGYHADNGHLYKEKGHGEPFGPTCTEGDTMGCGIKFLPGSDSDDYGGAAGSDSGSEFDYTPDQEDLYGYEESDEDYFEDEYDSEEDDDYFLEEQFLGRHGLRLPRRMKELKSRNKENHDTLDDSGRTCIVYFTKNGEKVGETECTVPSGGFYPIVAMLSEGERVRVNCYPLSG